MEEDWRSSIWGGGEGSRALSHPAGDCIRTTCNHFQLELLSKDDSFKLYSKLKSVLIIMTIC